MGDLEANTGLLEEIIVVPANEATWDDLEAIFGTRDAAVDFARQRGRPHSRATR